MSSLVVLSAGVLALGGDVRKFVAAFGSKSVPTRNWSRWDLVKNTLWDSMVRSRSHFANKYLNLFNNGSSPLGANAMIFHAGVRFCTRTLTDFSSTTPNLQYLTVWLAQRFDKKHRTSFMLSPVHLLFRRCGTHLFPIPSSPTTGTLRPHTENPRKKPFAEVLLRICARSMPTLRGPVTRAFGSGAGPVEGRHRDAHTRAQGRRYARLSTLGKNGVFPPALTIPRVQTQVSVRARKETANMCKSGIIGTWVGIFALVAIVLGELEHASKTASSIGRTFP
jgi:hypothetical protein